MAKVRELSTEIGGADLEERKGLLRKCAATSLNSKLVSGESEYFANMVVDAVTRLDPATLDLRMLGIKKVQASHAL